MIANQYLDSKYRLGNQGEAAGPWLLGIVKEALMHPDYLRQMQTQPCLMTMKMFAFHPHRKQL
jgi:hypothetical protein